MDIESLEKRVADLEAWQRRELERQAALNDTCRELSGKLKRLRNFKPKPRVRALESPVSIQ